MDRNTLIFELIKVSLEMFKASIDLIKGLAWPAVVGFSIWYFKDKFAKLLEEMTEWEGFGLKGKWSSRVQDAAKEVVEAQQEQLPVIHAEANQQIEPFNNATLDVKPPDAHVSNIDDLTLTDEEFVRLARVNRLNIIAYPEQSISIARLFLEKTVRRLLVRRNTMSMTPDDSFADRLNVLRNERAITKKQYDSALTLYKLGSEGFHDVSKRFSAGAVEGYVNAVHSLIMIMLKQQRLKGTFDD